MIVREDGYEDSQAASEPQWVKHKATDTPDLQNLQRNALPRCASVTDNRKKCHQEARRLLATPFLCQSQWIQFQLTGIFELCTLQQTCSTVRTRL